MDDRSSTGSSASRNMNIACAAVEVKEKMLFFNTSSKEPKRLTVCNFSTTKYFVSVTCSHPNLVSVTGLDMQVISAESKLEAIVDYLGGGEECHLVLLQVVAWKSKNFICEDFIPVYINCVPSRALQNHQYNLQQKMAAHLRNSAAMGSEDRSTDGYCDLINDISKEEKMLGKQQKCPTEDFDVINEGSLKQHSRGKCFDAGISFPEYLQNFSSHKKESKPPSDIATFSPSAAMPLSASCYASCYGEVDTRLSRRIKASTSEEACLYRASVGASQSLQGRGTQQMDRKGFGNDVMVCWIIIGIAIWQVFGFWWYGEFELVSLFSLSSALKQVFGLMAAFFCCIGYLLGQYVHS